jgi:hypothetical protein
MAATEYSLVLKLQKKFRYVNSESLALTIAAPEKQMTIQIQKIE